LQKKAGFSFFSKFYFFTFAPEMKTIRENRIIRIFLWVLIFFGHINIALDYIAPSNELEILDSDSHEPYFVAASNILDWDEKTKTDNSFSLNLSICSLFLLSVLNVIRFVPVYKYLSQVFDSIVKIFNLSPKYLINRALLI